MPDRDDNSRIEEDFENLVALLHGLDPVKLLAQLTLTFLTVPEDEFSDEGSDIHHWARWIEFLAGYLLTRDYPQGVLREIDGRDLQNIEHGVAKYFASISRYLFTDRADVGQNGVDLVVHLAKSDSLYMRGESYPHLLRSLARDLYGQHDEWFVHRLGFTIGDALSISESIVGECNRRINDQRQSCQQRAKDNVEELVRNGEAREDERAELETRIGCYYYFGNADGLMSLTLDEITGVSGSSREVCERYLNRLSQGFGYRNPKHPDTFTDPHSALWDYNTLYERPIVSHNGRYFVPLVSLFSEVLFHTFYYDLIADDDYWRRVGENKYGMWVEKKTAEFLKRVFPQREVLLNPKYPNGNELCDVLVLHDRNVFVVQCKAKRLRFDAKAGRDSRLIRDDLDKAVRESFVQGTRARDHFSRNQPARIRVEHGVTYWLIRNKYPTYTS